MSALADKDANARLASGDKMTMSAGEENKAMEGAKHKPMLGNKSKANNDLYVSPSDAILSPATKKLANFKQKQINKTNSRGPAARTLFARTASSCSGGFDDIEPTERK